MIYSFSLFESIKNGSSLLDKASPDFVPHEIFHKYSWVKPEESEWYYSIKRNSPIEIPRSRKFYDTLDDELREGVEILHRKGIPTTPSCSGHFNPDSFYSKIHKSLCSEETDIRERGIRLKDPETNKSHIYKDPNYRIPWDQKSFLEISREHGKKGIIGIMDPLGEIQRCLMESPGKDCQITRNGNLTFFITSPKDKKSLDSSWEYFNSSIKKFFNGL